MRAFDSRESRSHGPGTLDFDDEPIARTSSTNTMTDVTHPQFDVTHLPIPDARTYGEEVHPVETYRTDGQEADQRKACSESSASESEFQHALEVRISYGIDRGSSLGATSR